MSEKKKAIFYAVSNDNRPGNLAFSNFVFSLCQVCMEGTFQKTGYDPIVLSDLYDVSEFIRHDMIVTQDNIRESIFRSIIEYDTLIFLIEELPLNYEISQNRKDQTKRVFNPNVWFELGLAAPFENKSIIIISLLDNNPFYVRDAHYVLLDLEVMENYFYNNLNDKDWVFNKKITINSRSRKEMHDQMESIINRIKSSYKSEDENFKNLVNVIKEKLFKAKNPFTHDLQSFELSEGIAKLGASSMADFLKAFVNNTTAEFIDTEEKAFASLTDAVNSATSSLCTTRFANQSICIDDEDAKIKKAHDEFMKALCAKSKMKDIASYRIICNNHFTKWKDVLEILKNGGDVSVYIRKAEYTINFELVIIDKRITFIHFYQSSGNDDKNADVQKINSTVKLVGTKVSEKMYRVFRRLYLREDGDPSRTLLSVPKEVDLSDDEKIGGCLSLSNENQNGNLYYKRYLVEKFEEWFDRMFADDSQNHLDCTNMGIGLYVFCEDMLVRNNIVCIIKKKKAEEVFIKNIERIENEKNNQQRHISSEIKKDLTEFVNNLKT